LTTAVQRLFKFQMRVLVASEGSKVQRSKVLAAGLLLLASGREPATRSN
jgi:hypothetical protein